jgi:hypothetical protein
MENSGIYFLGGFLLETAVSLLYPSSGVERKENKSDGILIPLNVVTEENQPPKASSSSTQS